MEITKDEINEQLNNEENTKKNYITPIIQERWGPDINNIIMEYYFTDGRVNIDGDIISRGKRKKADYLLLCKDNIPLAIVEAKGINHSAMEGYQQVIEYAKILDVPFAYTTNGVDLVEEDMITGKNNTILKITDFPYPNELWNRYLKERRISSEKTKLINQPYYINSNKPKKPRYYQRIAINRVINAIIKEQKRLLLVMATGTGKTFTAFQIVWMLWKSKTKRKILYLVDRNALADQTMQKDFKPFVDAGVMVKMKNSKVKEETAYEVYIALYQQLISKDKKYYQDLPRDFFDLIIVDECHRGSADLDSNWHEILEYFNSATQLGLTATPKETEDISNIAYFGDAVYTYSLKQGIEDGFLAPYKVVSVELNIDKNGYYPPKGKLDKNGNLVKEKLYTQKDFDQSIIVEERRDIVAKKITEYMKVNDMRYSKTIVFCVDIPHVDAMVSRLKNLNSDLVKENPKYIMKITGDDEVGKAELENFTDPNTKYPVIAVTSKLMSTGVDSETCELIVLDKPIGSMTEFKQTVGRGTRIKESFTIDDEEHSKLHFTILDFRSNYLKFQDPEFDGEPVAVEKVGQDETFPKGKSKPKTKQKGNEGFRKVIIDGVEVEIEDEKVRYTDENGQFIKQNIDSCIKNNILSKYPKYEDFYENFKKSNDKDNLCKDLLIDNDCLSKLKNNFDYNIDLFDLVCFSGYKKSPISKEERLQKVYNSNIYTSLEDDKKEIIKMVLEQYKNDNFSNLKNVSIFNLPIFKKKYTPMKILKQIFKGKNNYIKLMDEIENVLY
ncbi:EcoAI/FtnUII family type I restriction enzme subunit R [Intestinibacter bartlettii]|uniref:EcoAI/FtnUII family type I restriction enzme subunit R n=1 Tax=Intestinibacter bartlettii TaxID=261299 RepID=UPI0034C19719